MGVESVLNKHLKTALKLVLTPTSLGETSLLAQPYFLGSYLESVSPETRHLDAVRGRVLGELLDQATQELEAKDRPAGKQYGKLLRLAYFHRRRRTDPTIWDELALSKAQYYRDHNEAVNRLGVLVLRRASPRLEMGPPPADITFWGREAELNLCKEALIAGRIVGVDGGGGVGKTTFAARAVVDIAERPLFWYTFHLGITDQLDSLVYAIAHFFQRHGTSALWLQFLADDGRIDVGILHQLLHSDINSIRDQQLVFCFDEIAVLQPEVENHAQILSLIESISQHAALLLVGQSIPLVTETHISLSGLGPEYIAHVLESARLMLNESDRVRLIKFTRGNPRLLNLYMAFALSGESIHETLSKLSTAPSMEALLNRVWVRLTKDQRTMLGRISVFRGSVPSHIWGSPKEQIVLRQLIDHHLLLLDARGGISMLPAYRQVLYARLGQDNREKFHLFAAQVRAELGEITSAAYHLVHGADPETAIRLWFAHKDQETAQGQAGAAQKMFDEISPKQLPTESVRELLALTLTGLYKHLGQYERARTTLRSVEWRMPQLWSSSKRLAGDLSELLGDFNAAKASFEQGQEIITNLLETELALFHRDLGWIYRRQKLLDDAWAEVEAAQYEVDNLKGHIHRDRGDLEQARENYLSALQLANKLGDLAAEARTRNALAALLIKQGAFADAEGHFEEAYQIFRRIGKLLSIASVRVNQSVACLLDGRPDDAIPYAAKALVIFQQLQHPYGIATAHQSFAEAYLACGRLEDAERHGWYAIETEEIVVVPDSLRVLGEIYAARSQYGRAEETLNQAIGAARENRDPYLEAYALRSLGIVKNRQGDMDALEDFQRAIALFEELGIASEVDKTRAELDDAGAETDE